MNHPFDVEIFFDGDCPLCRREMNFMRRFNRRGRVLFTDIAAADFRPDTVGLTQDKLMAEIHGRLSDGTIVVGVEVFRRLYSAIGWSWLAAVSRWPGISGMLDWAYRLFAKNRLRLTGRCDTHCAIGPSRPGL
ncbi:MAG: DUF393 domain-containing protein [Planctomycetota bacterium]|nr:DUF393 domain-containing protein [Planctomycetota bacterium]